MFKCMNLLACSICVHFLLLLQDTSSFECSGGSCFTYSIPPQNIVSGSRLGGYQLRSLTSSSLFSCLDACSMDCRCLSIDLQHSTGTCFLNWRDNETVSLTLDSDFTYYNIQVENFETDMSKSCDDVCCADHPCKNGGRCLDLCHHPRLRFNCTCSDGFTGRFCETNIDECSSSPCQNGGTCADHVNGFSCSCLDGYAGNLCEIDIDECASNPCPPKHDCLDHVNSYECVCSISYYGKGCIQQATRCSDYYNATAQTPSAWYGLVDTQGETYMTYCVFHYNESRISTLVMSYSFGNNSLYKNRPLFVDFPRNENTTGWYDHRLSKTRMQALSVVSSHWRLTCNYEKGAVIYYIKAAFENQNIISYNSSGSEVCIKLTSGNIKKIQVNGSYIRCVQEEGKMFFVYPYPSTVACPTPKVEITVDMAYFGYYEPYDFTFDCAEVSSSTTQLWFEQVVV